MPPRFLYNLLTLIPRWWHRHGFGIQSPSDYELVRDVLFEPLPYYAYDEQHLTTPAARQLYRIRLWKPNAEVINSPDEYTRAAATATDDTALVVEDISGQNAPLWRRILQDDRARVTFDMRHRGLVLFNSKRFKQNYLL